MDRNLKKLANFFVILSTTVRRISFHILELRLKGWTKANVENLNVRNNKASGRTKSQGPIYGSEGGGGGGGATPTTRS